ncbi:MAG: LytTR family DNA-binding domain-containing protein [Treponema sp.]|jgi:DNA-binding LytR/AlgR family response regulator|nr:LytTR family DNA-binding domain-containing protein [Treponema sp.]
MNILICDDIAEEAQNLEEAIKAAGFEGNLNCFNNGADALSHVKSGGAVDLCFLDIIMPEMDGICLARRLREAKYNGEIVFLTTTNEYAAESYQVGAHSYLIKPPNAQSIADILRKIADAKKNADTAGIPVVTRNMTRFLFFNEISYVEVMGKKVYFHLLDGGNVEITAALNEILPQFLEDTRFAQSHRSYIINMNAVSYIQDKEIFFRCGKKAPISKNYAEFARQYIKWVFGKERQ